MMFAYPNIAWQSRDPNTDLPCLRSEDMGSALLLLSVGCLSTSAMSAIFAQCLSDLLFT
jgi:hypothetical protein